MLNAMKRGVTICGKGEAMMYDLTEKDIECIAQWLNKACVEAPRHLKRESDLLQKLLKQREDNVIREENILKERSKVGSN
jgi:hypothetical protein